MTAKGKFTYKIDNYFPLQFFFIGLISLFIAGAFILSNQWWIAILIMIPALAFITMQYKTKLDFKNKYIVEEISMLGLALRREKSAFNKINKILIKETITSQTLNSRGNSTQTRYPVFKAYLMADGQSYQITENKSREKVEKKMKKLCELYTIDLDMQYHY